MPSSPVPLTTGRPGVDYIGTLWPNPGANGSEDGLENGDGLMWRSDYLRPVRAENIDLATYRALATRAGGEPPGGF